MYILQNKPLNITELLEILDEMLKLFIFNISPWLQ